VHPDNSLRNQLRKYKRNGWLLTAKVSGDVQLKLRKVLVDEPLGLLSRGGEFELIVDSGCTKTATGFEADFIPGTLANLEHPIRMDGIAGGLNIRQEGKVRYEIIDDKGNVQELVAEAYHIPQLGCRLFSPQAYFRQLRMEGKDPESKRTKQ
jgi:hypothetical protein